MTAPPQARPAQDRPASLPAHVTTPLLSLITERSMDEDYAHVARRRGEAGGSRSSASGAARKVTAVRTTVGVAASLTVLGLLIAVAAVQSQRDSEVDQLSRAALIEQIEGTRDDLAALARRRTDLTEELRTDQQRANAVQERQRDIAALQRRLGAATGYGAVTGPGLRITVGNPPGADATTEIRDEDLATLIDGLWAAGAEAIAIDDRRLTTLTGIRNTGRAVHIEGRPVTAPYVVEAVGDPGSLEADLLSTSQGAAWFVLVRSLGFDYAAQAVEDDLTLPAATLRALRHVAPATVGDNAPQPAPEPDSGASQP